MSKKIAEGTTALDVKSGSGAFAENPERARELAEAMVEIGGAHGVRTAAVLTDMSVPLGRTAGNALEVAESVEVLRGGGPTDVVELTVALAREMLALAGITDADPAEVLASGAAYLVWEAMIAAQGGDPSAPLPVASHVEELRAARSGVLERCDALAVGLAAWRLPAAHARTTRAGRRRRPPARRPRRRGHRRPAPPRAAHRYARRRRRGPRRARGRRRGERHPNPLPARRSSVPPSAPDPRELCVSARRVVRSCTASCPFLHGQLRIRAR